MRAKNISFAEVLRSKTHRSPQLEPKNNVHQLADLLQQWEKYPQSDYTLYLGPTQHIQKSQYSTSKMFCSRNQKEEVMFDSWIQKQSMMTQKPISENSQGYRSRQFDSHKVSQGSNRNNFNTRPQENSRNPKTITELVRRNKQTLHVQNSSQFANLGGNIQMIKSKTMQNEKKSQPPKPTSIRRQTQTHQAEFEEMPKQVKFIDNKTKLSTKKSKQSLQVPKFGMNFKNVFENKKKEDSIEDLVQSASNITNQIAQLAKKYLNQDQQYESKQYQNKYQEQQEQEEELLIEDSGKKPIINDQPMFSEDYAEKVKKAEEIDRLRKEEAKNKINDLMKNYKFGRKNEQMFTQPQIKFNYMQQKKVQENFQVGYSFASNQPFQQSRKDFQMNEISQTQKGKNEQQNEPSLKVQSSQQLQFKKRYVNYDYNQSLPQKTNPNLQSLNNEIKTSIREQQGVVNTNQPNSSFEKKLISYEKDSSQVEVVNLQRSNGNQRELPRKDSVEQFSKIEVVSKQAKSSALGNTSLFKVEIYTNQNKSINQQTKSSHQKIKIVSSGKNYHSGLSNKSQKSGSAKSSNQKNPVVEVPKDIKTEPFVPIVEKVAQNETFKDNFGGKQVSRSPFKTIKQVKNSIINPSKSPEIQQAKNVPAQETNTVKCSPFVRQQVSQNISKFKLSQFESKKEDITPTYSTNYIQPTYGNKNLMNLQNKYPYSTNDYGKQIGYKGSSIAFALPTQDESNTQPSYAIKGIKNSKQMLHDNYSTATYSQKQFSSPKTYQMHQKYEPKYATTINSSYQACQKFNSILNLTKKEFPDIENENLTKPKSPISNPNIEITGKRSILTQLDTKQSINFQDLNKKPGFHNIQKPLPHTKPEAQPKPTPLNLDNAVKKSLKQSINLSSSGQFKFDF